MLCRARKHCLGDLTCGIGVGISFKAFKRRTVYKCICRRGRQPLESKRGKRAAFRKYPVFRRGAESSAAYLTEICPGDELFFHIYSGRRRGGVERGVDFAALRRDKAARFYVDYHLPSADVCLAAYICPGPVYQPYKSGTVRTGNKPAQQHRRRVVHHNGGCAGAVKLFKQSGTTEAKANLGTVSLLEGKYSEAASELAGTGSHNPAVAYILAGQLDKASAAITCNCPRSNYLRAIIAARKGNASDVAKYLEIAKKNPELKARAEKDVEFANYR